MKRRPRHHVVAFGAVLGGLIGAIVALVVTLAGPGPTIWWGPAGFVTGIFAGAMVGFMLAEEVKGGEEDERATAEAEAALQAENEPNAATPE